MNTGSWDVAVERGLGRPPQFARIRLNGAAPLIGSSQAIRQVRARIERLAATPFAISIEGGFGPQPHSRGCAFRLRRRRGVAGAGQMAHWRVGCAPCGARRWPAHNELSARQDRWVSGDATG
jgi:hypothetical protein